MTTTPAAAAAATILNVDDYPPGRYARSRVLREAGFVVLEASSGGEALRLVREHAPDAVLLDYNLPDMAGVEVCRQIKASPRTQAIPVLQISATSNAVDNKVEAMSVGADTYLSEPIAPAELIAHVRAALRWRRAEEGLRESNERMAALYDEARRANEAKDEFLAVLSHELRTPLNAMLGWLKLLRGAPLTEAQRASALAVVERNAMAQARLIEDLLDVSRIVTGQLSMVMREVDLVPIVRQAIETVGPAAADQGLALEADIAVPRAFVRGDPMRLHQVTVNLLSNAIKFTEAGTIALTLRCDGGRVCVQVRDTGRGIDPAFLPFVFDRFRQADSSRTRPSGGLGLGLALSRHLVEAHAGRIEAASDGAGRGAIFTFELPEVEGAAAEDLGTASQRHGGRPERPDRPLEGLRLLLVEDDRDSREMLALMLAHSGAEITSAANAAQALEALDRREPDVLVADVGLPHMDGYALVRRIRESGRRTPAVALTGYASASDRAQALEAGFDDHLGKPVMPDALVNVISRVARK